MDEENKTATIDSDFSDLKSKNRKKGLIIVIIALLIACAAFGGYYFYKNRPKKIVTDIINEMFENYDELVNDDATLDITKDPFKVTGNLSVDTNIDGFDILNKESIGFGLGLDYSKQKFEMAAKLAEGKTNIVDAIIYALDDKMYLSLKDDYKGLIDLDETADFNEMFDLESLKSFDLSKDDMNYIVKTYKDVLIDSIDEKDLEKSSSTLEIDDKDTKVTKIAYVMNNKTLENLAKAMIDKTVDDKKLLDIWSKLTGVDKSELKDSLKEAKKQVEVPSDVKITINFYTKGFNNNLVGLEIKTKDGFKLSVVENKDNTDIVFDMSGVKIEFVVKESSEDKFDASVIINAMGEKITGDLIITRKENKKDNYTGALKFDVHYSDYYASIKLDYGVEVNAKVCDIDTSKAVKVTNSDIELANAIQKIYTRFTKSNLYKVLESTSSYDTAVYNY